MGVIILSMEKQGIVYILGAGASANALPIVSEMIERLQIFYLLMFTLNLSIDQKDENKNKINELIRELKDLLNNLKDKRSIDTYAKELYIKEDTAKLDTLKAILGTYLSFEEMFSDDEIRGFFESSFSGIDPKFFNTEKRDGVAFSSINSEIKDELGQPSNSGPEYISDLGCLRYLYKYNASNQGFQNNKTKVDQRYINFLVDIMEKADSFPSNIKLFSWNYDSQFFHAIKNLNFSILSKDDVIDYPFLKRLNGIAARRGINPATISSNLDMKQKIVECSDCFWRLRSTDYKDKNLLVKFAFEQSEALEKAEISSHIDDFDSISDLVVIGYSFPLANRNIDRSIFEAILKKVEYTRYKMINLKIYIQTPHSLDIDNDQYTISKTKIISIIQSIIPQLELSSDGAELSDVRKIPPRHFFTEQVTIPGVTKPSEVNEEFETLKIKFYNSWDPINFYIPQSF